MSASFGRADPRPGEPQSPVQSDDGHYYISLGPCLFLVPLCLFLLVSWTALGVLCILSPSLGTMLLFGPTVLTSSLSFLFFWPHCIGLRVLLIQESLVFLTLSCFLCLDADWGKFGVSYFELLLMFQNYAGHRLQAEKAIRPHLRPRRPVVFLGFQLV